MYCQGKKKDSTNCTKPIKAGARFCHLHLSQAVEESQEISSQPGRKICQGQTKKTGRCKKPAKDGSDFCSLHQDQSGELAAAGGSAPAPVVEDRSGETYTLTFCECAENHAGMQKLGDKADLGFTTQELRKFQADLLSNGVESKYYDLTIQDSVEAGVLVIPNGVDQLLGQGKADQLFQEHKTLQPSWDSKAFMKGRVVNKLARHNLCFADFDQEPNYQEGKGTVVDFKRLELTNQIRQALPKVFGDKSSNMFAEANYYYDVNKTYIGFHGDSERKRVIGVRVGADFPLFFQHYQQSQKVGPMTKINMSHGTIYIMSEEATGNDWMKKKKITLRHAAGFESVLKI